MQDPPKVLKDSIGLQKKKKKKVFHSCNNGQKYSTYNWKKSILQPVTNLVDEKDNV